MSQKSPVDATHPGKRRLTRSGRAVILTAMEAPIDIALLHRVLDYDPDTGSLVWKYRDKSLFLEGVVPTTKGLNIFNAKYAGKEALAHKSKTGHMTGNLFKKSLLAHRVAWALFYNNWPDDHIDHINGNPEDNRIANLRCVSQSVNVKNARKYKNNSSGAVGVYARKDGRFNAYVRVNGKASHLGCFGDFEEAKAKSEHERKKLGFSERHGK